MSSDSCGFVGESPYPERRVCSPLADTLSGIKSFRRRLLILLWVQSPMQRFFLFSVGLSNLPYLYFPSPFVSVFSFRHRKKPVESTASATPPIFPTFLNSPPYYRLSPHPRIYRAGLPDNEGPYEQRIPSQALTFLSFQLF